MCVCVCLERGSHGWVKSAARGCSRRSCRGCSRSRHNNNHTADNNTGHLPHCGVTVFSLLMEDWIDLPDIYT